MRIDSYGPAAVSAELAGTTGVPSVQSSANAVPEDKATLSAGSLSVPSLASQALQQAEARLAKVQALNHAVSSGAYSLDPSLIAKALASSGA